MYNKNLIKKDHLVFRNYTTKRLTDTFYANL